MGKAEVYLKSEYFTSIKCARRKTSKNYELGFGWTITLYHLIAMIVYCGFDTLQKGLSETYRPLKVYSN